MEKPFYEIKPVSIDKIKSIAKLERESFPDYPYPTEIFYYYYRKCPDLFLIAEKDERIIGYVLGCSEDDVGHIVSIAVAREFRGIGIGKSLLREVERKMIEKGVRRIRLEVSVSNQRAISLYSSLGYREIGRIRKYYPDGSDALIMEKTVLS